MRRLVLIALFLSACTGEPGNAPVTTAVAASAEASAKELTNCFLAGDFRPMARLTLPAIVDGMGGPDAMAKRIAEGMKGGPKIVGARAGSATTHRRGDVHYAFVPFTLEFAGMLGTEAKDSYLLGVSRDDGRTWHFVDGGNLTREKLVRVLPDFPSDLELPKRS